MRAHPTSPQLDSRRGLRRWAWAGALAFSVLLFGCGGIVKDDGSTDSDQDGCNSVESSTTNDSSPGTGTDSADGDTGTIWSDESSGSARLCACDSGQDYLVVVEDLRRDQMLVFTEADPAPGDLPLHQCSTPYPQMVLGACGSLVLTACNPDGECVALAHLGEDVYLNVATDGEVLRTVVGEASSTSFALDGQRADGKLQIDDENGPLYAIEFSSCVVTAEPPCR